MNREIILPRALAPGDKVYLIDPSNAFRENGIRSTLEGMKEFGLDIVVSETMGFKRGTPAERVEKLNRIIRDPEVKGIVCVWGGYGTMTLLDWLDYEALAENRPAFLGFSDVTAMHLAIQKKTGLVTYHGRSNCKDDPLPQTVRKDLWDRLQHPEEERILRNLDGSSTRVFHEGDCSGKLVGGNLTLISRLMGTPYEVDTEGKILFIEEVGEKPYRVHGMLMQLLMSGKLSAAAGILLGRFVDCDDAGRPGTGLEAVMNVLDQVDVPVIGELAAGHIRDPLTLPLGKMCHFRKGEVIL